MRGTSWRLAGVRRAADASSMINAIWSSSSHWRSLWHGLWMLSTHCSRSGSSGHATAVYRLYSIAFLRISAVIYDDLPVPLTTSRGRCTMQARCTAGGMLSRCGRCRVQQGPRATPSTSWSSSSAIFPTSVTSRWARARGRTESFAFATRALDAQRNVCNRKIFFSRTEPAAAWMDPLST